MGNWKPGMAGRDPVDEVPWGPRPWWEILHLHFMVLNSAAVSQALPSLLMIDGPLFCWMPQDLLVPIFFSGLCQFPVLAS